jgi:hypothetical protein
MCACPAQTARQTMICSRRLTWAWPREDKMVDGATTLVLAIGFLAVSWIIVIGGAAYFNKNMS